MGQEKSCLNVILSDRNNIYVAITRSQVVLNQEKISHQVQIRVEEAFFDAFSSKTHEFRSDFFKILAVRIDIYLGRKNQKVLRDFGKNLRILRKEMSGFIVYIDALVKDIAKTIRSKIYYNDKKQQKFAKTKRKLILSGWVQVQV